MKRYLLLISLLLSLSFAQQPLEELAPPDSILSVNMSYKEHYGESIKQDLKNLNWAQSTQTVQKLVKILVASDKFPELSNLLMAYESRNEAFSMIAEICPELSEQLPMPYSNQMSNHDGIELLETISFGGFSPTPVITVLARPVSGNNNLEAMFEAFVSCPGIDIPTLEQDGVTMYIMNDGGDMPFVFSIYNGLVIISTDPDNVRTTIRLANGSTEASLADSALYQQASSKLGSYKNSLRLSLDFAKIADIVNGYGSMFARGDDDRAALDRLLSIFYTLGGNVSQISAVPEGILSENLVAVNPDGGDTALLKLINCPGCQVINPPVLAPADSVAVSMNYLPLRESFNYLQSLLDDIANIYGESADIKELSQALLGLDLDTALFDWLGSEIHNYTLEPISPNAKTIFNGPAQATVISVRSVEQAKQGIAELRDFLIPLIAKLSDYSGNNPLSLLDNLGLSNDIPFDAMPPKFASDFMSELSVREYSYNNISIQRIQSGLNTDFAYAFIGNNLVIASPTSALEKIIDTAQSGLNIYTNPDFRMAKQSMPIGSSKFSYAEVDANLNGLADIIDLFVQPLAFGINKFLNLKITDSTTATEPPVMDENTPEVFDADIAGISPFATISSTDGVAGNLTENDLDNYGYYSHYYRLENIAQPGDTVKIMLTSPDFDTQLWLVDANRSVYIVGNDDMDDISTDSEISFNYEEGNDYWIEVSSFNGDGLGQYQVYIAVNGDFVSMQGSASSTTEMVTDAVATTDDASDSQNDDYLEADLTNMTAQSVTVPIQIDSNLGYGQVDNYDSTTVFYSIDGLSAGDIVKVSLSSDEFDTRLWLADTTNGVYVADNDDINENSTDSALVFKAQEGISYWLEVSSYDDATNGAFTLNLDYATEDELTAFGSSQSGNSDTEILDADLTNMQASPINVNQVIEGSLEASELDNYGYITDFYEIQGLNPGDNIVIDLSSTDFDAQLWLADETNRVYLYDNDDFDDNSLDSRISFSAQEGINYWIEVTSNSATENETGNYRLSVAYDNMSADNDNMDDGFNSTPMDNFDYSTSLSTEDIPSFTELLDLLDLIPNSLRVLAKHISTDVSYTNTTDSSIYSREILHIDW